MKDIYEAMVDLLNEQQPLVLTTILEKSGSAPREEGTKMIVKQDFSIIGTIGGGMLEAVVMKLSAEVFENREYRVKEFTLTNNEASELGMVCGGHVKVLLEYIDPFDKHIIERYKKAWELRKQGSDFVMITELPEDTGHISGMNKWVCTETGIFGKESSLVKDVIKRVREDFHDLTIGIEKTRSVFLTEPVFNYDIACIIGAGHIGQVLAKYVKDIGFYTLVADDREEFANRRRFSTADDVMVVPSFEHVMEHMHVNHNCYVIIVTRGHSYDKEVLAQALATKAKYIGMIGSKTKREKTYDTLREEGFTDMDFKRVHSPIGLAIHAQTPEEIAISIVAELIQVKRGG